MQRTCIWGVIAMLIWATVASGGECREVAVRPVWEGTGLIDYAGYTGCVVLHNENTRVILDPNCGGRVLEYSWKGANSIALDPKQDGWTWTPGEQQIDPYGGRLDIGPEMTIPKHPVLWLGKWQAEIIGPRAARLTSQEDAATGVQLVREFRLDKASSHLQVTQTIKNTSKEAKHWCHWSRTLAKGGGICLVPLTPNSRFPQGYIMYGPGPAMNYRPKEHPNVRVRERFLEILGAPEFPKFGIDSYAGWFAYLMADNLMFVKRFPVYPDRPYNEMAAITISIYYYQDVLCELEPIGPKNNIPPGESASYTENWWLLPFPFPEAGKQVDLRAVTDFVNQRAQ